jgi:filamentous hemagglutinin family protein
VVRSGTATATTSGSRLDITASHNAFLDWQSFNIGAGENVIFHQPSASSIVWNRINDPNPSQIFGHLDANGVVVLMNQSGFYFGPGSVVNAAGFVASTATTLPEFNSGGTWQFSGPPPSASIVNFGQIKVNSGGSAFLLAEKIVNQGVLMAPDGTLGLYAGKQIMMSERPDGRGLSVQVKLPEGSVDNSGRLIADGGSIYLHAQTVNQNGMIQANSVREKNGVIELVASDNINLGENSIIQARGEDAGVSAGGQVTVKSQGTFTDEKGSFVSVAGGVFGGNGGNLELSAPSMSEIHTVVDGHTAAGYAGGSLLIDPTDIFIGSTAATSGKPVIVDPAGTGTVGYGIYPGRLNLNVASSFIGLSHITLQATHNITVSSTWDLFASTGISAPGSTLTLEAGNDIIVANNASIKAGQGWSVTLEAGTDATQPERSILFQGNGSLEARDGSINLIAAKDVTVGSGFIRTMAGGNISVAAIGGSVNTGTDKKGFLFLASADTSQNNYMLVDPNLGGISTGAGGNVTITAGKDISSYLPTNDKSDTQASATDGGSGAFGTQAGNVTLVAGGNISGHYVVRNGTGIIQAGRDAGTTFDATAGTHDYALALSLVAGGWQVQAGQDIILQEVRNPNGVYNNQGFTGRLAAKHFFDYDPHAYVSLTAGGFVDLAGVSGSSLPRRSGVFDQGIPAIYAPSLSILANGLGGVQISDDLRLFPSPYGQLSITTTAGPLVGAKPGQLVNVIMSDSANSQYINAASFDDHAPVPLHLNDTEPVRLNIAGDMLDVLLVSPKHAEINVGGNMVNSLFSVQNLHASDVTQLNVTGDIIDWNEYHSVQVSAAPDFTLFDRAIPPDSSLARLAGQFHYDPATHLLTFRGRMTSTELTELTQLTVQAIDPVSKQPLFDAQHNPIIQPGYVSVVDPTAATALFNASKDIPQDPGPIGYTIAGPGTLNVTARNIDLGSSHGIESVGPANNYALGALSRSGAAINLYLSGNLDMFSSKICTEAGGAINIFAGGDINVGSSVFTGDFLARGIFTVAKSDVNVIAGGDINISGSRIAAYDGGNIFVKSLTGNVDAGHGGQGSAEVEMVYVDDHGRVLTYTPTIPGSGILATTFPPPLDPNFPASVNTVGNIQVETPRGDIIASAGGIVQIALNHTSYKNSSVTLEAGSRDAQGNVLYVGSIDASGSGVIGGNINLKATGGIKGLVVAQQNIIIGAGQNVNVTAIGSGNVSVSAGGSVSGTIVGVGGVSASGSSVDASMLSASGITANNSSVGSASQFTSANAAAAAGQGTTAADQEAKKAAASGNGTGSDTASDDEKKKRIGAGGPMIARRVGRVTVILPKA